MSKEEEEPDKPLETVGKAGDWTAYIGRGLKRVYGLRASRVYNFVTDEFKPNVAGNLRGQIRNAKARGMHGKVGLFVERLEKAVLVISFVQNLIDLEPQFDVISESDDSAAMKGLEYSRLVSDALLKAAATAVFSDAETIIQVAQFGLLKISKASKGGQGSRMLDAIRESNKLVVDHWTTLLNDLFDPAKQDMWAQQIIESLR